MDIRDLLVEQKEGVRQRTRNLFPKIPRDKVQWAPSAGALTLGQILRHLWHSEEGIRQVVRPGTWAYYERRKPNRLVDVIGSVEDIDEEIASLERVHTDTVALIRSLPVEEFPRVHEHAGLGMRRSTAGFFAGIVEHEAHHRGQIATYLRLLGVAEPTPYPGFK